MKVSIPNSLDIADYEYDNQTSEQTRIRLNYFPNDESKQIDYVLYYRESTSRFADKKRIRKRDRFIQSLSGYQANVQIIKVRVKGLINYVDVFVLLNIRIERLFEEAEKANIMMSFKQNECYSTKNLLSNLNGDQEMDSCLLYCCAPTMHEYFVGAFNQNAKFLFDNVTKQDNSYNDKFFTPKTRSLLTESILLRTQPAEDLLKQKASNPLELFDDAFVLHAETSRRHQTKFITELKDAYSTDHLLAEDVDEDHRDALRSEWISCSSSQPLNEIRNYFGELVGFYFAWTGFLQTSLTFPLFIGIALFIPQLVINLTGEYNPYIWEQKNRTANTSDLDYYYGLYGATFNNFLTPFYAIIISCWSMLFMETWRKKSKNLEYEWNVHDFKRNEIERPDAYSTRRNLCFRMFTYLIMILSIGLVLLNIFATVAFRVYIKKALKSYELIYQTLAGDIGSILIGMVISVIINFIYSFMVNWQTKFEVHRTQSEYEKSITVKLFIFEFANTFFPLVYIAFFRQIIWPSGFFNLGPEYQDSCNSQTCMTLLSLQVLITLLFSGLWRYVKTFLLHALKTDPFRNWKNESDFDKKYEIIQIDDKIDMSIISPKLLYKYKTACINLLVEKSKPAFEDNIRDEYLEKVTLYGVVILFSSAFMLGPIILFLIIFIDIRVDASRFLWYYKRPVGYPAQDIGIWWSILRFLSICSIITNSFVVMFICKWPIGEFNETSAQAKFIYGVLIQLAMIVFWALISNFVPNERRKDRLKKIKAAKIASAYVNQALTGELTYDKQPTSFTQATHESDEEQNQELYDENDAEVPSNSKTLINFVPQNKISPY